MMRRFLTMVSNPVYGYGSREELEEAGATKIAKSVEDLKNILLNWK